MIFYLGNPVDIVDDKIRGNRNTQKSWPYGYDSEYDIIVISKDGTLGPIFNINGLNIGLPEMPTDRKQFLNWDKTAQNQRWKRREEPKGLNEKTQFEHQYEDYILEEIRRRDQGIWLYLNGKEVYMTGGSYFFFQWNRLDEGYPTFRVIQNELLIYWEACKADNRCYGIDFVKPRRWGWSSICNSENIEAGTTNENKEIGIISKTGKDAKKMFGRLVRTFKKLPAFFMPVWDGTTTPKTELIFSEPTRKKRQEEEKLFDEGLDTTISWHNTVINAMDGEKIFRSVIDESGKFPKDCPFDEYWNIVKTSHRQGVRIVGKAMVGSTVNSKKKGGAEFEKIYKQSNPLKRNKNNQTESGLYHLFIDTVYCWEGFFDSYGFSIVEDPEKPVLNDLGEYITRGAITHWNNEVESRKNDPEGLNEFYRQNPRTINHAFRDDAEDCQFNLLHILEEMEHNREEHNHDEYGSDMIERGNLQWKNGVIDSEVVWRPDPKNGKFWIKSGCHPPKEYCNQKEMKMIFGKMAWAPIAEHVGCIGADPYNRTKTSDGRGSLGSLTLSTKPNASELPSNRIIVEYLDRAKKVEHFFEDALMLAIYYSVPILGELSNEAFLKHIKDRGYRHFSMNNPLKSYKELSYTEKELGGVPPQGDKIGLAQFAVVQAFIEDHVGVAMDERNRPIGEMGGMVFNRTLEQWKDVDLSDRTKFDAYISSSLSLVGNQKYILVQKTDDKPRRNPFQKYDNTGTLSKVI